MAGQIISRSQNVWLVRVYLGRTAAGKRRYLNKTVHGTKKDAQKWLTAALREKDLGVPIEPSRMSVDVFLDKWLKTVASQKVRAKTFAGYEQMLGSHIRPDLGIRPLSKLTTMEIQERYNAMIESGLSARTIQYTNMIFKQSLKQAVEWGLIIRNPCVGVSLPRKRRREMVVLSPSEVRRFLAAAREHPLGIVLEVAVTTGLRPSEYLALKWSDLDFERGTLSVNRSVDFQPGRGWAFAENKTGRSRRVVKLLSGLIPRLIEHRDHQDALRHEAGEDWQEHGLLFTTEIGTPIDRHNLTRRVFRPILKAAELPEIRLYDLRHTAATLALAAGVPVKVISEQLGHASATLTLDTYSHVLPHMQEEAATRVEALLSEPQPPKKASRHTIGTQPIQ